MAETAAFTKILDIRENEKNVAQNIYHQSLESFEKVATKLYNALKKKEAAEEAYEDFIQATTPIEQIKEQAVYIERLNSQIKELQQLVQRARNDMETKQIKLTDAHVEVKKFEKMIELRRDNEQQQRKRMENAFMDELSITQYLSHKNR